MRGNFRWIDSTESHWDVTTQRSHRLRLLGMSKLRPVVKGGTVLRFSKLPECDIVYNTGSKEIIVEAVVLLGIQTLLFWCDFVPIRLVLCHSFEVVPNFSARPSRLRCAHMACVPHSDHKVKGAPVRKYRQHTLNGVSKPPTALPTSDCALKERD